MSATSGADGGAPGAEAAPSSFEVLVGSDAFVGALTADVRDCERTLLVQFSTFEGDRSGQEFAALLLDRAEHGVEVRFTVDHYSDVVQSDYHPLLVHRYTERHHERDSTHALLDHLRASGVRIKRTAPPGFLGCFLLYRDHKKLVLLDDRVAYVGGINISDHNYAWHDLMVRITGPIVADLAADYRSTWDGATRTFDVVRETGDFVVNHSAGRPSINDELLRMIAGRVRRS